jgi:hypothetical protein
MLHFMMPLVFFQGFIKTILFNELNKVNKIFVYDGSLLFQGHFRVGGMFYLFIFPKVVRRMPERHQTLDKTATLLWFEFISKHTVPFRSNHNL